MDRLPEEGAVDGAIGPASRQPRQGIRPDARRGFEAVHPATADAAECAVQLPVVRALQAGRPHLQLALLRGPGRWTEAAGVRRIFLPARRRRQLESAVRTPR